MWRDDDADAELVDLLVTVLDEAPPQPPAERVAALRGRAESARLTVRTPSRASRPPPG